MRTISLSTSSVNPLRAEAAFIAAKQAGYSGVEVMVSPSKDTQSVTLLRDLMDKYQLPVTSVHAPTLLLCKFVWGTDPGGKLERSVEFAEQLGASSVVVHPPFRSSSYSPRFLPLVNKLNEEHPNVRVAVENMFPWMVRGRAKEMYGPSSKETCETVDWLTFDFSHASLSGMDVMSFFQEYHQKVQVIHFTDGSRRARGKGDAVKDEHLLPGEGDMPLREVYELLNRVGWAGETVLEVNTRNARTLEMKLPALQKSISYFHEINLVGTDIIVPS